MFNYVPSTSLTIQSTDTNFHKESEVKMHIERCVSQAL